MSGATYASGGTPSYAQALEGTQKASAAAREVGTSPAQPQAVAPDQAESTDSTSSVGIGDIVVTAQRRAENVQQVPIAVAAFSGAALQEKGVDNVSHPRSEERRVGKECVSTGRSRRSLEP